MTKNKTKLLLIHQNYKTQPAYRSVSVIIGESHFIFIFYNLIKQIRFFEPCSI
jgi:hypothetical protein